MESNIKGLVAAGHEMASELKAECGAVDMRSVAKLISDLATQLEVQLVRANALAAENARLKSAHPQPFGPEMMKALDAYEKYQDEVPETGMLDAFFILRDSIRVETPATDAFMAEVRAQVVEMAMEHMQSSGSLTFGDCYISLNEFAAQLRKGGVQ
ncbi:TPA: hypothetical protein ACHJ1S_002862 [Escherichia coli]|uniref:hypothetical protein n=1 Tax=Escherichia coli TaxID=562 RepID=UPI00025CAF57|nr:hypothetical protein [Escherichia coli]EEV5554887.1 hypothetical protein [Escherichia coli]EFC6820558.1 hypothetical protein [Escherichia coli]EFD8888296.1 hypothetical protein [Escherichia coli]EIJ03787.1 hypothetical protein ECB41_2739 [Escherichia coli B41]EJR4812341.1 hypothetical protein [Escherichia coli]